MGRLAIRVQPGASKDRLVGRWGDAWKLAIQAPPVDGKANDAAGRLLAKLLRVGRTEVQLVSGASSRTKTFETPLSSAEASSRLTEAYEEAETSK